MQLSLLLSRLYKFLENHKKYFVYFPLGIYWVIIFALTSFPTNALPSFGISDKIEHLLAYFVLSILLQLTLHFQNKYKFLKVKSGLYSFLICSLYGILDELHQYLIPGRYCDLLDMLANFIGITFGIILVNKFIKTFAVVKA